jgi:hypothetical protein
MKWLTRILAASALTLGVSLPVLAGPMTTSMSPGQETIGQVESVDGSIVKVKTLAGDTKTYQVEPSLVSSLNLATGSNVVIDSSRLQSGVVTYLTPYNALVELDGSGGEQDYYLTNVTRRYLSLGDRVVITPDSRIVREDLYKLSAADLRLRSVAVASSSTTTSTITSTTTTSGVSTRTVPQPANTSAEVVAAPAADPVKAPVRGLW